MDSSMRIVDAAEGLLQRQPGPVPRYRILRDIVRRPAGHPELAEAREAMLRSRWVTELTEEQGRHGGWARFHSAEAKARRKIPTTEFAVGRALQLGLEPADKVLVRAATYLERLLAGTLPWPEHKEPNDRWPTGQEMFIAATLAEIRPQHRLLRPIYRKWMAIAEQAFASGRYDPKDEWRAHCKLTGATTMRGSYLVLSNRHAMRLLASCERRLSDRTEKALVEWLWKTRRKLGYLDAPLARPADRLGRTVLHRWFGSQMIMLRFRSWPSKIREIIRGLWDMQDADGTWDFGPTVGLRLSENWRRRISRVMDHSVHVLLLLRAYYDSKPADSADKGMQRRAHRRRR
jgi:hypothetical protein